MEEWQSECNAFIIAIVIANSHQMVIDEHIGISSLFYKL
jgi:hypothetical protein